VTLLPLESAFYAIVITSCLLYFVRVVNGDVEQVYHKSVFIARECHIQVALMCSGVTRAAGGDERLIVKERQLTLGAQLVWLVLSWLAFVVVWRMGLREFSAVGA